MGGYPGQVAGAGYPGQGGYPGQVAGASYPGQGGYPGQVGELVFQVKEATQVK
ncbi:hypothetical protein MUB15_30230 [Priestia sp. OVS21]|nr:hypothetical protein [Priestia sp. OVS21]